jgi:Xaa-Pro aminopeptidase
MALYHEIRFLVGDPAALIELPRGDGTRRRVLIIRDIEMGRARRSARVDEVFCPRDFSPEGGLSGDRELATAQSVAECLRRAGITSVLADRSLPLVYQAQLAEIGIAVHCDLETSVLARRGKDEQEIAWLTESQAATERIMERALRMIATAEARSGGVLWAEGAELTSERLRTLISLWALEAGYNDPGAIVASGPTGADCHDHGHGPIHTGEPVIVDIFPRNRTTLYWGDCTRTVVHGDVPDEIARMHQAVLAAKHAATRATRAGVTGEAVHDATREAILAAGYQMGLPPSDAPESYCAMTHGTGHGVGLEIHEPPLLDKNGPRLVVGDCLTIEPGLYCRALGGIRVEDMVIVTSDGCRSLNQLPEGLDWAG